MIIDTPAPRSESTLLRFLRSGAVPTLALVLLVLVIVFGTLLGERIVGAGALQSMAFQLPELGILVIQSYTSFHDGSGRRAHYAREFFRRL